MKILMVSVLLLIYQVGYTDSSIAPSIEKCEISKSLVDAGVTSELAILGDCYYYGVTFTKNLESAKYYYLSSATYNSEYGKIKGGITLLFHGSTRIERSMGRYFLTEVSSSQTTVNENGENYRGIARYYLGLHFYKKNVESLSKDLFSSAVFEDGNIDALYALHYLDYIKGNEPELIGVISKIPYTFSCWIEFQEKREIPFPIDRSLIDSLREKLGSC